MKVIKFKNIDNSNNPIFVYKKYLIQYCSNISYYRESFKKPLNQLKQEEPTWWHKYIQYSFDYYDEIKTKFGHIPYVARSPNFPEPFIFYNSDIRKFIKDKIIENECDWQTVHKLIKNIQINSIESIWEFIEYNKDKYKPLDLIVTAGLWCKLNQKMKIWDYFKLKYAEEIKKII